MYTGIAMTANQSLSSPVSHAVRQEAGQHHHGTKVWGDSKEIVLYLFKVGLVMFCL